MHPPPVYFEHANSPKCVNVRPFMNSSGGRLQLHFINNKYLLYLRWHGVMAITTPAMKHAVFTCPWTRRGGCHPCVCVCEAFNDDEFDQSIYHYFRLKVRVSRLNTLNMAWSVDAAPANQSIIYYVLLLSEWQLFIDTHLLSNRISFPHSQRPQCCNGKEMMDSRLHSYVCYT